MKYIHYMKYNLHCIHHNLYMMCIHYNHRYRYRYMMNSLLSNFLSIQSHNLHHMNSNNRHHRSHRNYHSLRHLQHLYHSRLYIPHHNLYMRLRQFRCLVPLR